MNNSKGKYIFESLHPNVDKFFELEYNKVIKQTVLILKKRG